MPAQFPALMASLLARVKPLQLSEAVAEPVEPGSVKAAQSTVASGGQVMVGAAVSLTVMVCRQLAELPQSSVAVQVRRMV